MKGIAHNRKELTNIELRPQSFKLSEHDALKMASLFIIDLLAEEKNKQSSRECPSWHRKKCLGHDILAKANQESIETQLNTKDKNTTHVESIEQVCIEKLRKSKYTQMKKTTTNH